MRCLAILALLAVVGCSKSRSTEQPEPVELKRKFFDDTNDPAKKRAVPQPK